MKVLIEDVRLAFPALFEPKSVGDDDAPAYGGRFIIPPGHPAVKQIEAAIDAVAKEKWKDKAPIVMEVITEDGKVCFSKKPYKNKKTGEVWEGFEGQYHLGSRTAGDKPAPNVFDRARRPVTARDGVVYGGCYVDASVDIWAQDNRWGRRINATLLGVRFVRHGDAFSGSSPASADDFAEREPTEADDLI